jgi:hypothetical protein
VSTPTVAEVTRIRRVRERPSVRAAFVQALDAMLAETSSLQWPLTRYQRDPVGFAVEILGYTACRTLDELIAAVEAARANGEEPRVLWDKQIEILEAVADHRRVSVASGHKVSKSHTAALIALWFYGCFPRARVCITCVTGRQVDAIVWREVRMLRARAKERIPGRMHQLARSGFHSDDFREIVGFTARETEGVAGVSGANLLYIPDEASGIPDEIFEAIEGNRAGGGRVVMFSNPTRTEGEFFASHHDKKDKGFYRCLRISSEDSPNVRARRELIPGLASLEYIQEKREEWGEDSPLYKVRIKGEFVLNEQGRVISLHLITLAETRWKDPATPMDGRLYLGIDPAGPGEGGDESGFAWRRGQKVLDVVSMRGLSEDAHVAHALGLLAANRKPRDEAPIVVVDREGPIGVGIYAKLKAKADELRRTQDAFDVMGVRASDRAVRQPHVYDRVRDELFANLEKWLREGGAIPEDAKLAKDLHAPEWHQDVSGRIKITPKRELRKKLGRSTDRGDAVALAVWEPSAYAARFGGEGTPPPAADDGGRDDGGGLDPYGGTVDPYAGLKPWGGGR